MRDPEKFIERLIQATTVVHTKLAVTQTVMERFGKRLGPMTRVFMKCDGRKVYVKALEGPRAGAEVLYVPGWNDNKARVRKGSFPDVTINLDPRGMLMMEGQHHSIDHATIEYLGRTVQSSFERGRKVAGFSASYVGERAFDGRTGDCLSLRAPWKVTPYRVAKGEDAWSLADKLGVPPHLLLHVNGLSRMGQIRPGRSIMAPAYYGIGIDIALDKETGLPLHMTVYEGEGVKYEDYAWSGYDLATPISDLDFSPDNPAYGFGTGLLGLMGKEVQELEEDPVT